MKVKGFSREALLGVGGGGVRERKVSGEAH